MDRNDDESAEPAVVVRAVRLTPSLEDFIGHPGYGTAQLRQDLDRFVFLLGGNDGEPLFGP